MLKFKTNATQIILTLAFACHSLLAAQPSRKVQLGIDVLLQEQIQLIKGKRVGLITNPTGVNSALVSTIDLLKAQPDVQLVALFGPEHGVRGDIYAGEKVDNFIDAKTGVPVYSLYGKTKKPTPEMLQDIDVLIYDIQDIGNRTYTYIYTMALAMEAAREQQKKFIVLDRPNPLGGELVEGPILNPRFSSFIGLYPIPYIYGLTVGELARYFNEEFNIKCDLTVVPMKGWQRSMTFAETGLTWVPTSPHIPHALTALYCAITGCMGELNTVNVGVGYTAPFEFIGLPGINGDSLAQFLNQLRLPGVHFRAISYRPYYGNQQQTALQGIQIHILNQKILKPMLTQLAIAQALVKLYPEKEIFNTPRVESFDKACGTDRIRLELLAGKSAAELYHSWDNEVAQFRQKCKPYLLYQ